ncbi:MAG: hypothetical protein FWE36_06045 [Erysipelotrichales bacterium]|nr:hypothetical protein [Erysipelotrichales bacterium]
MLKKVWGLGIIFFSMFLLTVSSACNSAEKIELAEHKAAAVSVLEENVNDKHSIVYSADNWDLILELLKDGKRLINRASKRIRVDFLRLYYVEQINNVPRKLNDETVTQIKEDAVRLIYLDICLTTEEDIVFFYYGTYNDYIVVMMHNWKAGYFRQVTEDILGIIYPNTGQHIRLWKKGEFHRLSPAYEQGLLTMADLEEIANIHEKEWDDIFTNWKVMF